MLFTQVKRKKYGDFLEHYFTNNTNLKSELRVISYENKENVFSFYSDLGVFSKDKIDYGSRTLVDTILKEEQRQNLKILDVGCGYGFIGITLSKILNSEVLMVDVNKRAVHLCERNIKENKVNAKALVGDTYENVTGKFDIIVTNPPIRAGKDVVLNILLKAREYLNENGVLWFVIRKDQGAKSILKILDETYDCDIVKKDKGFYIMRAKIY
uniref:class I SAM-dependent methyltransferase n=1 Tax=Candidatus Ventrenecus sp. TaxID=3085654 RepID=UPI0040262584